MSHFNFREWLKSVLNASAAFSGRYGFDPLGGFLLFVHVTIILSPRRLPTEILSSTAS